MLPTTGPRWHFHSALKQNASGSETVKSQCDSANPRWISNRTNMPEEQQSRLLGGASSLLFARPSHLPFLFLFFCMNSSLACTDILIPPPNPPQHIYLRELIKSWSSHFPSHCSPRPHFNNQGHSNNCRGQGRAKGGHIFAKHKPRQTPSECLPP